MLLCLHGYHYFNLESLVSRRTSDLQTAHADLLAYQDQLRALASETSLIEERERRKLATDLHDCISQSLSLSLMDLASLEESETVDQARQQAAIISARLDQALLSTQNLTFDLCPPELYQIGLEAAIRELTIQMGKEYGLPIAFQDDKSHKPVSDDVRYFLFRATRELLVNVTKHARASQARVSLRRQDKNLVIGVADNGVGWAHTEGTVPLAGAAVLGYSISANAWRNRRFLDDPIRAGRGTIVTLEIPSQAGTCEEEKP